MKEILDLCIKSFDTKDYGSSYTYAEIGGHDKEMSDTFKFWKSLSAFYLGNKDEFQELCEELLKSDKLPKELKQRNIDNYIFTARHLPIQKEMDISKLIKLQHFVASNPSIIKVKDGFWINIRYVNYEVKNGGYFVRSTGNVRSVEDPITTRNFLFKANLEFKDITFVKELKPKNLPPGKDLSIIGLEDVRLYLKDNKLKGIGTRYDTPNDKCQMSIIDVETDESCYVNFGKSLVQKNWVPLEDKFIYSLNPYITLKIDNKGEVFDIQYKQEGTKFDLRGSSQFVKVKDEYWGITHQVIYASEGRRYISRTVILNAKYEIKHVSKPYYFFHHGIEYVAGLAYHEPYFYISASKNDACAKILVVKLEDLY